VAQITAYYPPHLGGVEVVAKHLAEGLAERRRVRVLTSDVGARPVPRRHVQGNLTVQRYRGRDVANVPVIPGMAAAVLRLPPGTILHTHVTQAFVPEVAAFGAMWRSRPLVAHFHMDVKPTGQAGMYEHWKRFVLGPILRGAARVVVLSPEQAGQVTARYRVAPERVEVLPNGVEDLYFQPASHQRRPEDPFRVLFVGRLSPQKDLPLLFSALDRLHPDAELVVVGDGELRPQVENMARSLRGTSVRIVGQQTPDQVAAWYRWADVLLSSSEREGMPLSLLEAMASSLPVVATDVPGTRETVAGAAKLAERSPEALAVALEEVRGHPRLADEMAERGRKVVEARRWSAVVRQLEAMYDEIGPGGTP